MAMRWSPQGQSGATIDRVVGLRQSINRIAAEEVIWDPYINVRQFFPFNEISFFQGCIPARDLFETYMSGCVLRQLGYVQTIPRTPLGQTINHSMSNPARAKEVWKLNVENFEDWRNHSLITESRGRVAYPLWECEQRYMNWYKKYGCPIVCVHPKNPQPGMNESNEPHKRCRVNPYLMISTANDLIDPLLDRWRCGSLISATEAMACMASARSRLDHDQVSFPPPPDVPGPSTSASRSRRRT